MKHNERLTDIIKKKEFKCFWVCYHYLIDAGYDSMDAFGYSLKEFGEDKIFTNVAFIRIDIGDIYRTLTYGEKVEPLLIIGLINETNSHLSGLYKIYLKKLSENNKKNLEIESTCSIVTIKKLNPVIIDYLLSVANDFFKIDLKEYIKKSNENEREQFKERIRGEYNHPSHPSDYITSVDPATMHMVTTNRLTGKQINDYGIR